MKNNFELLFLFSVILVLVLLCSEFSGFNWVLLGVSDQNSYLYFVSINVDLIILNSIENYEFIFNTIIAVKTYDDVKKNRALIFTENAKKYGYKIKIKKG